MEAHITRGIEGHMIDGLQLKAGYGTAAYVLNSRFARYFAESGTRFDSSSSRAIRLRLADHCFLEPASVRLQLATNNLSTPVELTPVAQPLAMFRSTRLFMAGQRVEDWAEQEHANTLRSRIRAAVRQVATP